MEHLPAIAADAPNASECRERLAHFILEHEAALRRRIGAEVRGAPGVDADDVFSTLLRRVDYAAAKGSFRPRSGPETWGFVTQVVKRAVERHRRRASRFAQVLRGFAREVEPWDEPPTGDERAELAAIVQQLERTRPQDAELIRQRLRGRRWKDIAGTMGVSEEALRQRWCSLLARIRGT